MSDEIAGCSPQQLRLAGFAGALRDPLVCALESQVALQDSLSDAKERLERLLAAYEIFRTRVRCADGDWAQHIGPPGRERVESLRADGEAQARELLDEWRQRHGAPVRTREQSIATLLVSWGDQQVLVCALAPAELADARTLGLLVEALVNPASRPPEDDRLLQYADLAEWLNRLYEDDSGEQARRYWRQQRCPVSAPLPAPATAPATAPTAGRFEPRASLAHAVPALSPHAYAAAWVLTLARLSGTGSVTLGRYSAGREIAVLGDAPGSLGRVLPLAVAVRWSEPVEVLVQHLGEAFAQQAEFQECFRWSLLGGVSAPQAAEYCDLAFECHDLVEVFGTAQGIEDFVIDAHGEPFALKCSVLRSALGGQLRVHYDRTRVDGQWVERLAERVARVCAQVAGEPQVAAGQVDYLLGAEQDEQAQWAVCPKALPAALALHQSFEEQARRGPDRIAVRCDGQAVDYAWLDRRANQIAHALAAAGVAPGDRVALCIDRGIALVAILLGVLKAGAAYVPIDPGYPAARVRRVCADAQVSLAIVSARSAAQFDGERCLEVEQLGRAADGQHDGKPHVEVDLDAPAYLIYTSGSTGQPKGVRVAHRSLHNYVHWCADQYALHEGAGAIVHSSISFDLTVTSLLAPLAVGGTAVLVPDREGVDGLIALLAKQGDFSVLKLTPSHLELLRQALTPEQMGTCARVLVLGGEALYWRQIEPWLESNPALVVFNEYGPTEATVGCCVERITATSERGGEVVPIGKPLYNSRLAVLGADQRQLPSGCVGELYIAGTPLALGYHGQPASADVGRGSGFLEAGVPGVLEERSYRTGDLVRYLPDGRLEFVGRTDTQVKIRGHRVELGEIEAVINAQIGVSSAVVQLRNVAEQDASDNDVLVAYFVAAQDQDQHFEKTLAVAVREVLPEYMVPARWVRLAAMPLNAHGKIARDELPAPGRRTPYRAPTNGVESRLVKIWQEVLGIEQVGVDDNYFELGGDSIRSIAVIAAAKSEGIALTLDELFAHPTVATLGARARVASTDASPTSTPFALLSEEDRAQLTPGALVDAYPMTVLQRGMVFHNQVQQEERLYHDIFSYRLRINSRFALEGAAIERAYAVLCKRHPALRTTFSLSGFSEPLQLVHAPEAANGLQVEDLRGQASHAQRQVIAALIQAEKDRGFDIAQLPLVRLFVHLLREDELQLSISFHHAVLDGWSDAMLLRELFETAQQLLAGESVDDSEGPVKFSEFVRMEQAILRDEQAIAFWSGRLSNAPATALPREASEPGEASILTQALAISNATSERLKAVAAQLQVPLKSVLLALHTRMLTLLTGQADVSTCIVAAGRPEVEGGDRVLGLFINSIPFRLSLERCAEGTWRSLISEAFAEEIECLRYRRFPYAKMKQLAPDYAVSDVLFYFTDYHNLESLFERGGVQLLETEPFERSSFPFVIHFNLDPHTKQLSGELECDASLFSGAQLERYCQLYEHALAALPGALDEPFDSLSTAAAGTTSAYWSDMLIWRAMTREREASDGAAAYWRERLAGAQPGPAWRPQGVTPEAKDADGWTHLEVCLDAQRYNAWVELGQQHGLEVGELAIACLSIILGRYANASDVLVRRVIEAAPGPASTVAGPCRTLALRTDTSGGVDLAAYLRRCARAYTEDFEHEGLSFEAYVHDQVRRQQSALRSEVVVGEGWDLASSAHLPPRCVLLPGQRLPLTAVDDATLIVALDNSTRGRRLRMRWSALCAPELLAQLADSFMALCTRAPGERGVFLEHLSVLSPTEQSRLLARAGQDQDGFPDPPESVLEQLLRVARERPDAVAVEVAGGRLTYGALDARSSAYAAVLAAHGVGVGAYVGIHAQACDDFAIAMLSILKLHATYVPLAVSDPVARTARLVANAGLRWVAAGPTSLPVLGSELAAQVLPIEVPDQAEPPSGHPAPEEAPDPLADLYVIHTSGSTGTPKGVCVGQGAFAQHLAAVGEHYAITAADRVLQFASLSVDASQELLLCTLTAGATLVAAPAEGLAPAHFDAYIDAQQITVLDLPPAYVATLCDQGEAAFVTLRRQVRLLIMGGASLPVTVLASLRAFAVQCKILNAYGPTEAVVTPVLHECPHETASAAGTVPIGRPLPGRRVYVVDEQLQLVPDGVAGELCIGGRPLARAYLNDDPLTERSFTPDPFSSSEGARLYRTGDRVRWVAGESLQFLGRRDEQVSVRGFRVELGEIEARLGEHEAVTVACVVAADTQQGADLVAYVALTREAAQSRESHGDGAHYFGALLRHHLTQCLPAHMVPQAVMVLDQLPLTASGKVDRQILAQRGPVEMAPLIAPASATERELCEVWRQVLKVEQVGANSHFFRLGGDSLASLQLASILREQQMPIEARDVFEAPTVAELATLIEHRRTSSAVLGSTARGADGPAIIPRVASSDDSGTASVDLDSLLLDLDDE